MKWFELRDKRAVIAGVVLTCFLAGATLTVWSNRNEKPQEVWLNVFIHGSFGTILGLLDLSRVLQDQVSGTHYRALIKRMRNDDLFYRYQPILQRGLVKITPTFDYTLIGNKMYAAYPLIKAYHLVAQQVESPKIINIFYTFGWTGLVSKSSRRFEAVRLYNQLSDELDRYHKNGIRPKIRLISHSHGGNLCLNLGGVHGVVTTKNFATTAQFSKDNNENESIHALLAMIKTLKTKEEVACQPDQKKWDYVPLNKDLFIDELVMFGNPIQQETECFFCSPIFGKVFNFYSGQDLVQRADWVSSKQKLSNQRVNNAIASGQHGNKKVYQAKIMLERPLISGKYFKGCVLHKKEKLGINDQTLEKEANIVDQLLTGVNVFKRATKDPTHKALWFFLCKNEALENSTTLAYLPTMILTPLFLRAIKKSGLHDCDLNIKDDGQQLFIEYTRHDNQVCHGAITMPLATIDQIKNGTTLWGKFDASLEKEFEVMYQHFKG